MRSLRPRRLRASSNLGLPALLLALWAASSAGVAEAYVRSRTSKGTATAWRSGCVLVQPDLSGSPDLDLAVSTPAIRRSMEAWSTATAVCSYMHINYVEPAAVDAHFDGLNVIKFRTDRWCHPDDSKSSGICYDAIAAGITTVFYADRPGEADDGTMLDADIELNNLNFTFDVVDPLASVSRQPRTGTTVADLENTLVHELGHLLGIDHTCKDSATPSQEVDQDGNPPTACSALRSLAQSDRLAITEATMFNSAAPSEVKKRSPEADDVAAVCAAYPLAADPARCGPQAISVYTGSNGCAMATRGRASAAGGFAFVLLLALGAFRRRRGLAP